MIISDGVFLGVVYSELLFAPGSMRAGSVQDLRFFFFFFFLA